MPHAASVASPSVPPRRRRRHRLRRGLLLTTGAALLGFAALGRILAPEPPPAVEDRVAQAPAAVVAAAPPVLDWMLDPAPALGAGVHSFRAEAPPAAPVPAVAGTAPAAAAPEPAGLAVPLPVPRPPELRGPRLAEAPRLASRRVLPSTQSVFRAATGGEEPSFLERLFGRQEAPAGPALAYAAPGGLERTPRPRLSPVPETSAGTAVYDITAQRVTLPGGEALEAHSGLGATMDDPRYVHLRMRGSTPPGVYTLTEREALFHGVRAIRLNPVGGPGAIHGRTGILAHTYMLGPSGASNGCVSFRNYDRFLQAFLRGEVRRLVVVAGNGQDGPPAGGSRFGLLERGSRRGDGA
ncbi:DUF2778 domain-containing protein [Methylobacterium oryzihabitans]|uniref:DUF2778 domain-containing protein n=1 Tax=Methylobacterium oryzihabitans TaxID=2499852 RepID=A0A437PAA2_9HYPH|nr:DUF2778 domain-containing protein [Methylobacterium oryzihabitans]RVU19141.1 DUF2778 domain-containing protein [Methylobacterium oryzihabitans]